MTLRSLALALAPLALAPPALIALPLPASAQESATPTATTTPSAAPERSICPNISFIFPEQGRAGTPVTWNFFSDVQPAKVPDRWTITRLDPGPVEVVQVTGPSESASFTATVWVATTYRVTNEAEGCEPASATFTRTMRTYSCPDAPTPYHRVDVNAPVQIAVTGNSATDTVRLVRATPGPRLTVREATGNPTWTVRVPESTDLVLGQSNDGGPGHTDCLPDPIRIEVVPHLTIAAVRHTTRDYTFSGRVLPGRGQTVSLYRVDPDGSRVLTSRTVVGRDGTYRVRRAFTGSGRFGFEARVGVASTNLAGASPVRPTVIH